MAPKHLWEEWNKIISTIKSSPSLFILLDYDGTLTPIVERPEDAYLSHETRNLLKTLADKQGYKVAIVSGRTLEDVKKRVGLEDLYYAGNHGLELSGPDVEFVHPRAKRLAGSVSKVYEELKGELGGFEGVIVEDKIFTVSVHYRAAPEEKVDLVKQKVLEVIRGWQRLQLNCGKKVLEVRPKLDWNKGRAAQLLIERVAPESLPIYAGDDTSDEDAFLKLSRGVTILVANTPIQTSAKYYLRSPDEVKELLKQLAVL